MNRTVDPSLRVYPEEVNILHYWYILNQAKLLLLTLSVIFALVGLGAAFTMKPVYEAVVTVVPVKSAAGNTVDLRGLASRATGGLIDSFLGSGQSGVQLEALPILKSRQFLTRFIQDKELMPVLFEPAHFEQDDPEDIPTLHDAYVKFSKTILSIEEDRQTKVLRLKIHWTDPILAADWANSLITQVNFDIRQRVIADSNRSIEYLNRELLNTSIMQIKQSIYRLIESQTHTIMLAETLSDYAFRIIDPAVPADPDRFVRPKRRQIVLFSTVLGLGSGIFLVILRDSIRRLKYQEDGE